LKQTPQTPPIDTRPGRRDIGGLVSVIWSLVLWLGAAAQVMRCSVGAAFGRGLLAGVILIIPAFILYSVASYFF
jgi:hypothetical protein